MAEGYARASVKPEADVVGISRARTKWNVMVNAELPRRINEAFEIATSGRPGPVLVDLPKDVTACILRRTIPTDTALPSLPSAASRAAMELTAKQLAASTARRRPEIHGGSEGVPLSHYQRAERTGLIKPQTVVEELSNLTADRKDKTYIATGVGQHQMWAAQHFRWRHPRSMITSGGLGTMGYGLPAAEW
ncbi:hypothetical protein Trco_000101 [Trichoderma cornu-damae]|uniref:Thiamine pyrophosphate enzyme TPP-binding domain-containing protein n=1 Tax=Trichoderma cornu-damae TaxID=654480 RepID=A0A9P8QRS1_9HYPO|nr:hypothetical protein Trco_000101 [Trichoderma cornu-damae]